MSRANAYEQYVLERVNYERAKAGVQPLALDGSLNLAAERHSDWMLDYDTFSHTGVNGTRAGDRMKAAGYVFSGAWTWGENIAWQAIGSTGLQAMADILHTNLMNSSGHRANILNGSYREAGIGYEVGSFQGYTAAMLTQNFATTAGNPFLTGVAFDDKDGDRTYDIGEGLGGITVTVKTGAGSTVATTTAAPGGGYEFELGAGTYNVTFSGSGFAAKTSTVTIGSSNVKLDWIDPAASGTTTTTSPTTIATISGTSSSETVSGTTSGEVLRGLAGNDNVYGKEGNDRLEGGDGADLLRGGAGRDVLVGGSGSDRFDWDSVGEAGKSALRDIVSDFVRGSDKIDLAGIDARADMSGNNAFSFIGTSAFSGIDGQVRYQLFDTAGEDYTLVQGDVNGDRVADFEVQITGLLPLSSSDFVL